jgi:hypothetical protein
MDDLTNLLTNIDLIPEKVENIIDPESIVDITNVLLQCEDYAGNLVSPLFELERPSKDYYAANLNLYVFFITNMTTGQNYVYLYDERAQGKNAEALCNLRIRYHIKILNENYTGKNKLIPRILYTIMDNCVGTICINISVLILLLILMIIILKSILYIYKIRAK